jgi:hypothetical protein
MLHLTSPPQILYPLQREHFSLGLMGLCYLYYIQKDMDELHHNNTCGINVISPIYIMNDNKSVLLHDECGISLFYICLQLTIHYYIPT